MLKIPPNLKCILACCLNIPSVGLDNGIILTISLGCPSLHNLIRELKKKKQANPTYDLWFENVAHVPIPSEQKLSH